MSIVRENFGDRNGCVRVVIQQRREFWVVKHISRVNQACQSREMCKSNFETRTRFTSANVNGIAICTNNGIFATRTVCSAVAGCEL